MKFGLLDYGHVNVFLAHQLLELHGFISEAIYVELQDFEMLVHFGRFLEADYLRQEVGSAGYVGLLLWNYEVVGPLVSLMK